MLKRHTSFLSCTLLIAACASAGCTSGRVGDDPLLCTARYAAFRRRPEVAVVLDRSCAMQMRFDGTTPASGPTDPEGRWGAVTAALTAAGMDLTITGWSLVMTPEDPAVCTMTGDLSIYPEIGSGLVIPDVLGATGETPFDVCAGGTSEVPVEAALGVINGSDDVGITGDPFVLVIAAGAPSCGSTALTLEEAAANTAHDIYVLALAPDATATPLLESLALPDEAGARPGYRLASSAAEVDAAVQQILSERESCVLDLFSDEGLPIPDEEELRVWVDGEPVMLDPDNGWVLSLDGAIALNGTLCERMLAGEITRVDAAVGCDVDLCVVIDPDDMGEGYETCDGLDNDCDDIVDEDCE